MVAGMVADMEVEDMLADMEVDKVADVVANTANDKKDKNWPNMELDMVADMEVDKVADMVADKKIDINININNTTQFDNLSKQKRTIAY